MRHTLKNFLKKEFDNLYKSKFGKNFLKIFSGMGISQFVPFLIAPILTRLYTPEDFAILGLFSSTALLFSNIATFSYDQAIMLPKKEKNAINVLVLSIMCVFGVSMLSAVIMISLNSKIINLFGNTDMGVWLYLVPISVFLGGVFQSLNVWASREKKFSRLAMRNISQTTATAGTKLILGILKYAEGGLIVGTLTGQSVATSFLGWQTFKDNINFKQISKKSIKRNAIRYKDFPIFTNWQGFSDIINKTGTIYVISNLFGANILGSFSFTIGILRRPVGIIGKSISPVFYQKISENYHNGVNNWPFLKKIIIRLFLVSSLPFIVIFFFAPELFVFVFGNQWEQAGLYAQILTPYIFINFLISPFATIFFVYDKQKLFLKINLMKNVGSVTLFLLVGLITDNFIFSLVTYVIINFVVAFVNLIYIREITINT